MRRHQLSEAQILRAMERQEQAVKKPYHKIPNAQYLYRHSPSGRYYGAKKLCGKRYEVSLRTTDRKVAERRLRDWVDNLDRLDHEKERTTLSELLETFVSVNSGKSESTKTGHRCFLKKLRGTWPFGMNIEVRHVKPSHLKVWLASHESRLKNTTYNYYAGCLKQIFEIAVDDRIIIESPFARVKTQWKKPQPPKRLIPTKEQFAAIVEAIRTQRFTDHAEESADFVEFLGLAGLGQAEASSLKWEDVNWDENRISIRRQKTDVRFSVPIYPDLRPLLERMAKGEGATPPDQLVFAIKDAKKALQAACAKLGYPRFSQRSLRRYRIGVLWKARVDLKLIAKWQGHRDGGKLIMDTYTEVFGDDDAAYEQQQLAKLTVAA